MSKLMLSARSVAGIAMAVVLGFGTAEARNEGEEGRVTRGGHCISPAGADLNERYGVTEAIVTPFCTVVPAGERWWPQTRWLTENSWVVIPPGFTPAGATPIEDFNLKFAGARYVVDPGTKQEQSHSFPASILRTGYVDLVLGYPFSAWLAQLNPVSVGPHVVDIYIRMSAEHWDGFGTDPGNHIPAGESLYDQLSFEVVSLKSE